MAVEAGCERTHFQSGGMNMKTVRLTMGQALIRFLENPAYNEANNIASAMCARYMLSNAYVFEADLLISNPKIITKYHYTSDFLAIKKEQISNTMRN